MYAFSADTYTILQKEIRKGEFLQERHLKTSPKTGCALLAEWEWNTLKKRSKTDPSCPQLSSRKNRPIFLCRCTKTGIQGQKQSSSQKNQPIFL